MQLNNLPITITRKKIKNMYLRVHPDGTITVSAPRRVSDKVIWDFIHSKSDWILEQREKMLKRQSVSSPIEVTYSTGETHYFWGLPCTLLVEETTGRSSVKFVENQRFGEASEADGTDDAFGIIHMRAPKESTVEQRKHLLEEFYREKLKLVVPDLMEHYARIVGKAPAEWRIRNMKTKWGTCNVVDKRIWLSLNLAKKHPDCLEYVIAHELTHLHEPNHSKAFWARMDKYFPEWRAVRKLLNER